MTPIPLPVKRPEGVEGGRDRRTGKVNAVASKMRRGKQQALASGAGCRLGGDDLFWRYRRPKGGEEATEQGGELASPLRTARANLAEQRGANHF